MTTTTSHKTATINGITVSIGDMASAWKYSRQDDREYLARGPVVAIGQDSDSGRFSALVWDRWSGKSRWFWIIHDERLESINQFEIIRHSI